MKKLLCAASFVALLSSQKILAEGPVALASAPVIRSGVVDMQRVILGVKDGKTAQEQLQKEVQTKQKEWSTKEDELRKLDKEFADQASFLSEDAKKRKREEFEKKAMAVQKDKMEFQEQIRGKEMTATKAITDKASAIVTQLAQEKDLYQVVERQTSGFLYIKDPVDLTEDVIRLFDTSKDVAKASVKGKDTKKGG